jgi:signal transduction histidine kinase
MTRAARAKSPPIRRNARVDILRLAARALLEHPKFPDAAVAILATGKAAVAADAGLIALPTASEAGFQIVITDPGGVDFPAAGWTPQLSRLGARAGKFGRAVLANRLSRAKAKPAAAGQPVILRSALVAPILIAGEIAGFVGLLNKRGRFSVGDAQVAEISAAMLAVSLYNSRAIAGLETKRQRLARAVRQGSKQLRQARERFRVAESNARSIAEALRDATVVLTRSLDRETVLVTLLDRLRQVIPFDRASVMLVEEPSLVSVRVVFDGHRVEQVAPAVRSSFDPADHPIVQSILETGSTALISDLRNHPGWSLPVDRSSAASWLGVPLFARGNVAGLIALSKREPSAFSDGHVRLAEAMSSQASVAVENAVLFEQMQASTVRMQLLSRRLVEAHEAERRHIARELHDEAGQALASLRYGLRLLEREISKGESVSERVVELMQRTDAVIDGLHRLAADLRPASLDHLGLDAALRQYTRAAAAKYGLVVRFKARGFTSERLPSTVETALYRVVQEAMTNVVRHAGATGVDVLLERSGERVKVVIEDDGVGFEADRVPVGGHFGLLGLRERADALGGTLTVESAPGMGTTIVVEVASANPYPDR